MKLFNTLHDQDLNGQGNYLLGMIDLLPVERRRHGSYEQPSESRRQHSITYTVPTGNGENKRVCKKTFVDIFGIKSSKRIETLVKKKKMGETFYKDKRGGTKSFKFTLADRNEVKLHIGSFPTESSHYSRKSSDKQYLSQDLNTNRLYLAFKEKHPNSKVSFAFYRKVFLNDFPKLAFRKPRSDTCKKCDRLNNEIKSANQLLANTAKGKLEFHQRKAEAAYNAMKHDSNDSTEPESDTTTIVIDLQKVFPLPKLTHSDMYYLRQLSCYNFGIHICDSNNSLMCLWHEFEASRGGNEMASCLLEAINSGSLTDKKKLCIWSDNCCGQIKNSMMLYLYIFLVSIGIFDRIDHKFLVVGHSYSSADRDFAIIEKNWKKCKAEVMTDLKNVIISARTKNPFKVVDMAGKFLDLKKVSKDTISTTKLAISKASWIRVERETPGIVKSKRTFNELEPWLEVPVFKKHVDVTKVTSSCFTTLLKPNVAESKKNDIRQVIPFLKEENRQFYNTLLGE